MPQTSLSRASLSPRSPTHNRAGDVMTGRGIDQILPYPSKPHLYEPYVRSALGYVEIVEQLKGPIARPVDFAYIWGETLGELERARPDARIINLETAVTVAEDAWPGKGIHYRMHPANAPVLSAAGIGLLQPRKQSRSRLGIRRADGDPQHAAASGYPHRRRCPLPPVGNRLDPSRQPSTEPGQLELQFPVSAWF
jgi:poly-gamma-glutamate capsule biosynthesis protein CapA/YwtB (metallophosphatase superfamily)